MNETLLIIGKLILSIILGGIIGMERKTFGKPAGSRTFGLVAMGSTLFTVISIYGINTMPNVDPSRMISQIIVGIGFIGAGLIILHRHQVEGLTTAAALWTTAAVGIAVGLGWWYIAIFATALIFLLLFFLGQFEFVKEHKKTLWSRFQKKSKRKWHL